MIRLRFEKASQIFELNSDSSNRSVRETNLNALYEKQKIQIVLPGDEMLSNRQIVGKFVNSADSSSDAALIAEIRPLIFEGDLEKQKEKLAKLKELGIRDVLAENIGSLAMAKEMGFNVHGGFTLNILNSVALKEYQSLGLCSATLSIELSFLNAKNLVSDLKQNEISIPVGMITYGHLPMMKFRSCPARTVNGCGDCSGHPQITDRMGKKFNIICRGKQYSELLNFVPVYVGDKSIPKLDFEELYFTIESQAYCKKLYDMYINKIPADFERTAGLYFRELL